VLEVAVAGWSAAGRGDAGGVPDLGQVPQLDPRIMTRSLEPVVACLQGDRVQRDQQVRMAGQAGGQPPGPVPAGRPVLAGGGEGEPWRVAVAGPAGRGMITGRGMAAGRGGPAGRGGFVPLGGACMVPGSGPGAAVADGVSLLVGDAETIGGRGVGGGGPGQLPGQDRVARGGTRDEIRSFGERTRAVHDYSADISDKLERGRKRCTFMAWSDGQPDVRIRRIADVACSYLCVVLYVASGCGNRQFILANQAAAGGLILVTSRRVLHGLPDARFFPLRTLADLAALELLRSAGGPAVDEHEGAARRIVTLCGCLPLALLIAGAMLNTPGYDPAALADDLEEERDSLEEVPLAERDSSMHAAVHASIILSYRRMTTDLRRQFQLCGVFPGTELSASALAAMADELKADDSHTERTKRRKQLAQRALRELANRNLLMLSRTGEFGPRWRQHDLVRVSARVCQRDDPLVDHDASVTRLMDAQETTLEVINRWWFGAQPSSGRTGGLLNFSDQAQTLRWVVAERANLLASVDSRLPGAGAIAQYLGPVLRDIDITAETKGDGASAAQAPLDRYADARHCFEIQYRTAEHRDAPVHLVKALALRQMAHLDCWVARYERAQQQYREAAEISQADKDYYGLAMSLKGLGSIGRLTDDYPLAVDSLSEAITLLEPLSYRLNPQHEIAVAQLAYTIAELADVMTKLHRFDAALALLARAEDLHRALKNDSGLAGVYYHQGDVLRQTGKFGAARDRFNTALALNRKLERPDMTAQAQWGLAQVEKDSGEPALAAAMFAEIAALWRSWGNDLQQARMLLGQADAERLSKQWNEARTHFGCARELCLRCADLEGQAEAYEGLAKVGAATGDGSADAHRKAAIALYRQIGHPKADEL
jgi:tetratricopeptide (TPR) repeat protein